jgi:hypothetical protein
VNNVHVGVSVGGGDAIGVLNLAAHNTIDANSIVVGSGAGPQTATLRLGLTNDVTATQLIVGDGWSNAAVTIAGGGAVTLGSPAKRTNVQVAVGNINNDTSYTSRIDLTGGSFTGYLGDLVVAQKDGSANWPLTGSFVGAAGGSVDIGAPGTNTANVYVGRNLSNTGPTSGTVDFSGLATLTARVNTIAVGTATGTADSTGVLNLAQSNTIDAVSIVVGGKGKHDNVLRLGNANTILVDEWLIGQDNANGSVTIPSGGSLNLGSPTRRANIKIATGTVLTDTPTYFGSLDLTNAALVAYLDDVLVGDRSTASGGANGTFTVSARPENRIEATRITLGGARSSGAMTFGGGQMTVGSIVKGAGTGTFNWTGGQLSVGTFGTPAIPFNLANTGMGTLAPGSAASAVGTTTVNGTYTQSATATTAIDIAGVSPGTGNDLLSVSGAATLAGTLRLTILNNFAPSVGQNIVVANYASRTGAFAFVAPPRLPQDVAFQVDYASSPTQLSVRMVSPTSQSFTAPGSAGTFGTAANWDTNAAPDTRSSVSIVNAVASPKTVSVNASTTVHRVSLQGVAGGPVTLDVPAGVQLGVANQVSVGANATLSGGGTVVGDVVLAGGAVAPGAAAAGALAVGGSFTAQAGSTYRADLAGTAASGSYDRVNIAGRATLGGTLVVNLTGPAPVAMDSYTVLTFASRGGWFQSYDNLDVPGPLVLAPVYSDTSVRLVATLAGDATMDGVVDFNDLVKLAQNYNSALASDVDNAWQSADFTGDRTVDFNDLVALAQNYNTSAIGGGAPGGAAASFDSDLAAAFASVPEPASVATTLGLLALTGLARRRRPGRRPAA